MDIVCDTIIQYYLWLNMYISMMIMTNWTYIYIVHALYLCTYFFRKSLVPCAGSWCTRWVGI